MTPSDLDYGTVSVGSSPMQTVVVSNAGTALLMISSLNVTSSEPNAFGLRPSPSLPFISVGLDTNVDAEIGLGSTPSTVAPGDSATMNVTYEPATEGPLVGTLQIDSNAIDSPSVDVTLEGTGVPVPVIVPIAVQ